MSAIAGRITPGAWAFLTGFRVWASWRSAVPVLKRTLSMASVLALTACNAPPLYESRAQEYLAKQGVPSSLIVRLVERKPLSDRDAATLEELGNTMVLHLLPGNPITALLHLLASNPSIPASMIARLAANRDEEVRWGVAYNPNAPVETLLRLRTPGKYSTMNEYLARNPRIPTEVLLQMYRNTESNRSAFAMNPNCPADLMREIAELGTDMDRSWLAANPNLPTDLIARLARDPSENVQRFLAQNRAFKNWKAAGGDSATGVPR